MEGIELQSSIQSMLQDKYLQYMLLRYVIMLGYTAPTKRTLIPKISRVILHTGAALPPSFGALSLHYRRSLRKETTALARWNAFGTLKCSGSNNPC